MTRTHTHSPIFSHTCWISKSVFQYCWVSSIFKKQLSYWWETHIVSSQGYPVHIPDLKRAFTSVDYSFLVSSVKWVPPYSPTPQPSLSMALFSSNPHHGLFLYLCLFHRLASSVRAETSSLVSYHLKQYILAGTCQQLLRKWTSVPCILCRHNLSCFILRH